MPKFPKSSAEVRALEQSLIAGLTKNPHFPSPPVSADELSKLLDEFTADCDAQTAAYAAAEQSTVAKQGSYDRITLAMKKDISYAEREAEGDDVKLRSIGWSARAPQTPLEIPGQPRNFEVLRQGVGSFGADWKRPADGGDAACYIVKRRKRSEGDWEAAGTFFETEAEFSDQECGVELDFCVAAVNRAGEGQPSNIVTVVL